jgi:DNA-binding NarL/FixJ family response regulator
MTLPIGDHYGVRRTLLIVDDHARFRRLARALLETAGFAVVGEAADGAAALRAVRTMQPDIVLLDVVLPGEDGFAVCERITQQEEPARPIVVLTSTRDAASYGDRVSRSGARGFIPKTELTGATLTALTA